MSIQNVVVAGGGTLGSQIAYQTAFSGKHVFLYDINEAAIEAAKARTVTWGKSYTEDIHASIEEIQRAHQNLHYTTDLAHAVADADLVIEAIPEAIAIKEKFYKELSALLPEKTIVTTNTSTLLPSQFMEFTGRPEKFLALHFANLIWKRNTAEIMPTEKTAKEPIDEVRTFAREIGMIPIFIKKEQPGYLLNSLLVPWIRAALDLWARDIAEPLDIDKTWMVATNVEMGPFGIMDMIGLRTVYMVTLGGENHEDPVVKVALARLKEMLDAGNIGFESGKGFYDYPHPAYEK